VRRLPPGAPILTAAEMRAAEAASGVPVPELMQRAGAAIAREVARLAAGRDILVLAGPGKNGGDARIAAEMLSTWGHDVIVAGHEDLGGVEPREVLVDGLFGTGLSRPFAQSGEVARLAAEAFVIAIDLPSGLETDTGCDLGATPADVTIALGALKPAHVLADGVSLCGHVLIGDIGIEVPTDWRTIARPRVAVPEPGAHKYSRGMVAIVSGTMPGAGRLAARAAMHGGAGYVVLAQHFVLPRRREPSLDPRLRGGTIDPDALVHRTFDEIVDDDRVTTLIVGPGLGRDDAVRDTLDRALASARALVLDGDALSLLGTDAIARLSGRNASAILTPHSGEFDRMFGASDASKIERTIAAARACGCAIIHKGADTVIAYPDGRVTVSSAASPWLASAGTGDVLAGLVAAAETPEAAVWLHARAATLAGPALIADDLIAAIPVAIGECI
jgi:hydroxyethylthiazole kinase-like uncharacterized protein yjeF